MFIKIHNQQPDFKDFNATLSHDGLKIWFKGYFYFKSEFYTSNIACKLLNDIYKNEQLASVKDMNGVFVCVILDVVSRSLYICNDRYGFHKIFYYSDDNTVLISDSFEQIAGQVNGIELDKTSFYEFIQCRFVSGKYTLAKNIYCIEPASVYTIDFRQAQIQIEHNCYWYYRQTSKKITLPEAEKEIHHTLNQIIVRYIDQLFQGKNIGINLTGGLDSRYLLALLLNNGIESQKIKAFTFGSPQCEDIRFSRLVAQATKIQHTPGLFNEEFRDFFDAGKIDEVIRQIGAYTYYFQGYAINKYSGFYKDIDYLLSGSDGYFIGLKANPRLFSLKNNSQLVDYLYKLNATILKGSQVQGLLSENESHLSQILQARISEYLNPDLDPVSGYFDWTIKNRHRKYLLSLHDLFPSNTICLLPYYDYEFIDLMAGYPYEVLENQKPYINTMFKNAFIENYKSLASIPADQRGKFFQVGGNFTTKKKRKYTFRKLLKKIFNTYDQDYSYPIRPLLDKRKSFKAVIEIIRTSYPEYLNRDKVLKYVKKHRRSEFFVRYGLLVILSILRFEKIFRKNNS